MYRNCKSVLEAAIYLPNLRFNSSSLLECLRLDCIRVLALYSWEHGSGVRTTTPGTTLPQTPRGIPEIPPFPVESLMLVVLDRTPHILCFQMVKLLELSLVNGISLSEI